jgi:hypothetical protein
MYLYYNSKISLNFGHCVQYKYFNTKNYYEFKKQLTLKEIKKLGEFSIYENKKDFCYDDIRHNKNINFIHNKQKTEILLNQKFIGLLKTKNLHENKEFLKTLLTSNDKIYWNILLLTNIIYH